MSYPYLGQLPVQTIDYAIDYSFNRATEEATTTGVTQEEALPIITVSLQAVPKPSNYAFYLEQLAEQKALADDFLSRLGIPEYVEIIYNPSEAADL